MLSQTTITPESVGSVAALTDKKVKLMVSAEFVNSNDTTTDVNVGIYVDGKLFNDKYITVQGIKRSLMTQNVTGNNWGEMNETLWLGIAEDERPGFGEPVTPPEQLTVWTITDVGLKAGQCDADIHSLSGSETGDTLNGKAFHTMIQFGDTETVLEGDAYLRMNIGTDHSNALMLDAVADGNLRLFHYAGGITKGWTLITLSQVGQELVGKELYITITTEFVNSNGTTTDLNVGVYINGALYQGSYIKIEDVPVASLKQNFYMENWGAASEVVTVRDPFLTDYPQISDELTAKDFGLDNATIKNESLVAGYDNKSLVATAITVNMSFPKAQGNEIGFGGNDCGVRLQSKGNGELVLSYVDSKGNLKQIAVLNAKKAGVSSLTDKTLKWRFAFQIFEGAENLGELQLGVYINGQRYGLFTVSEVEISSLKRALAINAVNGTFKISTPTYTEMTLNDFSILDTKVAANPKEAYRKSNFYDYGLLDSRAVSCILNFSATEGDRVIFGSTEWVGLNISSCADGSIWLYYNDANWNVKNIAHLYAEDLGMDTLVGKDIKFRVTFDMLKTSKDKADVKFGVYVNDKFFDNVLLEDLDVVDFTRTCNVFIHKGPAALKSVKMPINLSIFGFSADWKKTLGL